MAVITIADAGVISYVSTRNLAERFGFGSLSWLYPLCLDAVAAVGMDLWMSDSRAQRPAKWLALSAVSLSLAANVADWMFTGIGAAVLGAVPPVMLAALLLTMHRHATSAPPLGRTEPVPVPVPIATQHQPQPGPPAGPVPPRARGTGGRQPRVSDDVLLPQIRTREQTAGPLSKRRVMRDFRVGNDRAIRLLRAARNGHDVDPTPTPMNQ